MHTRYARVSVGQARHVEWRLHTISEDSREIPLPVESIANPPGSFNDLCALYMQVPTQTASARLRDGTRLMSVPSAIDHCSGTEYRQ
jgi:hypothetical protein